MSEGHSKERIGVFRRLKTWLIGLVGAVLVAMVVKWATYYADPGFEADTNRIEIADMEVECNFSVSNILSDRIVENVDNNVEILPDGRKFSAYLLLKGMLFQKVVDSGEPYQDYNCLFPDPRFYFEFRLLGRIETTADGKRCRNVSSSHSDYYDGQGVYFLKDKLVHSSIYTCLDGSGLWVTEREEVSDPGPR